jgi:hypothetical protein
MLLKDQESVAEKRAEYGGAGGMGAGGGGTSGGAGAGSEAGAGGGTEAASTEGTRARGGEHGDRSTGVGRAGPADDGGRTAGTPPEGVASKDGRIPPDVGDGRDDDVVARQIREAAMKEKDPAIREKLWEEYRRYKAGQRGDGR